MDQVLLKLAPFNALHLSALDNLKIAYSIAKTAGIKVSACEIRLSAIDVHCSTSRTVHTAELSRYALCLDKALDKLPSERAQRASADISTIAITSSLTTPITSQSTTSVQSCDACVWLDCGRTNDYAASISVMAGADIARIAEQTTLTLSVLTEHHIHLLCMDNAHFDHC